MLTHYPHVPFQDFAQAVQTRLHHRWCWQVTRTLCPPPPPLSYHTAHIGKSLVHFLPYPTVSFGTVPLTTIPLTTVRLATVHRPGRGGQEICHRVPLLRPGRGKYHHPSTSTPWPESCPIPSVWRYIHSPSISCAFSACQVIECLDPLMVGTSTLRLTPCLDSCTPCSVWVDYIELVPLEFCHRVPLLGQNGKQPIPNQQ